MIRRPVLAAALAYVVIGVLTVVLARSASTTQLTTIWRLAAWLLSLIVFASHVAYERLRVGNATARSALHAAIAVALAAFVLAAVGPVRSHWSANDFWKTAVLSLVLWPVLTGIPAFVVALAGGAVLGRASGKRGTHP